jgi:hypothetical protein
MKPSGSARTRHRFGAQGEGGAATSTRCAPGQPARGDRMGRGTGSLPGLRRCADLRRHTPGHSNQPTTEHPINPGFGSGKKFGVGGNRDPTGPVFMGEGPPSMVPLLPTAVVFRHPRRRASPPAQSADIPSSATGQITAPAPWMTESTGRLPLFCWVLGLVGMSPGRTIRKAAGMIFGWCAAALRAARRSPAGLSSPTFGTRPAGLGRT